MTELRLIVAYLAGIGLVLVVWHWLSRQPPRSRWVRRYGGALHLRLGLGIPAVLFCAAFVYIGLPSLLAGFRGVSWFGIILFTMSALGALLGVHAAVFMSVIVTDDHLYRYPFTHVRWTDVVEVEDGEDQWGSLTRIIRRPDVGSVVTIHHVAYPQSQGERHFLRRFLSLKPRTA